MKETYRRDTYKPELVTGVYVRVQGSKKTGYTFVVSETASAWIRGVEHPGHGVTLREYITTGEELPEDFREQCTKLKTTMKLS